MATFSGVSFRTVLYGSSDYKNAVALREEILRKPLGLSFSLQELEQERGHVHIAGFVGKDLCATAVLVPEGESFKMQRVAVKAGLQTKGIGSAMMAYCDNYARKHKVACIHCSARHTAISFYLKNGYQTEGAPYNEDGIPHQKMKKSVLLQSKL